MSRIIDLIESVKDSKVLFVGDKIIDEYQYVSPMGMASKENMLAAKAQHIERFYGGVCAAAKHAQDFCAGVEIFSSVLVCALSGSSRSLSTF